MQARCGVGVRGWFWLNLGLACVVNLFDSTAGEASLVRSNLFVAGSHGYTLYRIPGLVTTPAGSVLVYCEARRNSSGDWGAIDLVYRRSLDAGRTWGPLLHFPRPEVAITPNLVALRQSLKQPGDLTLNNPVLIATRSGTVHLLFCAEYARCFYARSDDQGLTFTRPVDITPVFDGYRPEYPWTVLATGPGHGIELRSGRLLVPVWLSTGTGGHAHRPSCVSTIYSDDQGRTWQRGEIVVRPPTLLNPSETAAVELADQRVLLNIRHEGPEPFRAVCVGGDGATGWSCPRLDHQLPEPVCAASLVRFSPGSAQTLILFANPDPQPHSVEGKPVRARRNLTVKLSEDEAKTWAIAKVLEPGPSGYSDLATGPGGRIFCFYERGGLGANAFRPEALCLAQFDLEWLRGRP